MRCGSKVGAQRGHSWRQGEESEKEREKIRRQRRNLCSGRDRAETNDPLHTPREREIKHCATVFHPETSTKREASPSHSHASTDRRLARAVPNGDVKSLYLPWSERGTYLAAYPPTTFAHSPRERVYLPYDGDGGDDDGMVDCVW